jgi:succinylarginine dihydrolase
MVQIQSALEANLDGLVGPTHNYAGLSEGNLASERHAKGVSRPRAAALQGLRKARLLMELGLPQGLLPPLQRPDLAGLRALGFSGSDSAVVEAAWRSSPALLARYMSASSMWTANAATVVPSSDSLDGRLHLVVANLAAKPHRAIEADQTFEALSRLFADPDHFAVHRALPHHPTLGDEGAANHTRLASTHGSPGLHLFVYGIDEAGGPAPTRFAARQSRLASESVARLGALEPERALFAQQHPAAIDAGVFHNDVICVGNGSLLFHHEQAFVDTAAVYRAVSAKLPEARFEVVPTAAVALEEAVRSYLFNAQLLTLPTGATMLLAPEECREEPSVRRYLDGMVARGVLDEVRYLDLRESMRNGGGPACLRLRAVMTEAERAATAPGLWLTPERCDALEHWVTRHYRELLSPDDLRDPLLLQESFAALEALTSLLGLGGDFYPFQRG